MQKFSKKRTIRIFPHQTVKPIRPPSRMARNPNDKKCLPNWWKAFFNALLNLQSAFRISHTQGESDKLLRRKRYETKILSRLTRKCKSLEKENCKTLSPLERGEGHLWQGVDGYILGHRKF